MEKELEFRKPNINDLPAIESFKSEYLKSGDHMDGAGTLRRLGAAEWLENNKTLESGDGPNNVKSFQYGLFSDSGRLLGLLQIRTELKGYLIDFGGNIGYCVRPSERRKGYAKFMLFKALDVCRKEGLDKVLITCLEHNEASAKTIESCGGKYERTVFDNLNYQKNLKRYWIDL